MQHISLSPVKTGTLLSAELRLRGTDEAALDEALSFGLSWKLRKPALQLDR